MNYPSGLGKLNARGISSFDKTSRACSSAWLERIPDKDEAGGSSPPRPTSMNFGIRGD